ncbi:MAG: DegV family protein [Acholeplasmatales bacterium]|nr:MAG: DegV family protein [Acholeplasmatales bacterium]
MEKTAVIAISTGCLDYLDFTHADLYMLRCKILLKDAQYDDFTQMNAEQFYQILRDDPDVVPTSSMPALGEVSDLYETLEKKGYTDAIVVSISSALSGTYQTCLMAKNAFLGELKVHVFDSKNAAISEGFLTIKALKMLETGASAKAVLESLDKLSLSRKQYFMVDNLRLLVKNGRLSNAQGFLGGLLKIKPILAVNESGKIVPYEKVRTQRKALEKMADHVIKDLKSLRNFVVTYNTSDNTEGYNYLKSRIEDAFPNHTYYTAPITPVIGCHTGAGTVGVAYFDLDALIPKRVVY